MPFTVASLFRKLLPLIGIGLGCLILVTDPVPIQTLRHLVFDQYQRWYPRAYQDVGVRIVDIDDESLARLGQWPWPRDKIAKLTAALKKAGASSIGFDMLFSEPDRTSPSAFIHRWPLNTEVKNQIAALPDPDEQFASVLRTGRVVLGIAETSKDHQSKIAGIGLVIKGEPKKLSLPRLNGALTALPTLATAAAGNGAITFTPDADGIVRRVPLLVAVGNAVIPSLSAEVVRAAQSARSMIVHNQNTGIAQIDIGKFRIPTTADGQFWIHFTGPVAKRTISAWRILAGDFPANSLPNTLLMVGTSAQGLQDLRFSPLGGVIPGVQIHAEALEQIRSGHWLVRPPWTLPLEAAILLFVGLALIVFTLRSSALMAGLVAIITLFCLNVMGWIAFRRYGLLLDAVTPSIGLMLIYMMASVSRHMATEARQRWIQQAFARYISPNRVAYLMSHPQELALGGSRQNCSFVFTDLTGFTSLIERTAPDAAVGYLNGYLDGMIQTAFHYEGTLDRIVGDAVAIMFSAPTIQSDHKQRALACALDMQKFAIQYAASLLPDVVLESTRIGVHSGEVVVGNFGGKTIFDYRAMGDTVNIAARLETLNRHVGTTMCMSEVVKNACPDIPSRAVGRVRLKGKSEYVKVFEPLQSSDPEYDDAYALMVNADPTAIRIFEGLAVNRPNDRLVAFHLHRLKTEGVIIDELILMQEK